MVQIVRRAGQGGSRLVIAGCTDFINRMLADGTYDKDTTIVACVSIFEREHHIQERLWSLQLDDRYGQKMPSDPSLLVLMMPVGSDLFSVHQRRDIVQGFDDQAARGVRDLEKDDERDDKRKDEDGEMGGGGEDVDEDTIMAKEDGRDDGAVGGGGQGDAETGGDVEDLPIEDADEDVLKKRKFDAYSFDDSVPNNEERMITTTLMPHGPIGPEEVLGTADEH